MVVLPLYFLLFTSQLQIITELRVTCWLSDEELTKMLYGSIIIFLSTVLHFYLSWILTASPFLDGYHPHPYKTDINQGTNYNMGK